MDNYISRQSVFDIIKNTKHFYADPLSYKYVVNLLKELPNITQDGDLISRQEVDNYIVKLLDGYLYDEESIGI